MTNYKVVYVFTFGWSPELVIRPLVEEGVTKDVAIVLLASKPELDHVTKKVKEALDNLRKFFEMAGIVEHYYVEIDGNRDLVEICRNIIRVLKTFAEAEQLKFFLTGGMRVLVVAALIAAKLIGSVRRNVEVKLSREDAPVLYSLPLAMLEVSPKSLTESQKEVLRQLKVIGEARFEDLALGRSSVTVRKHLTKLREMGLVAYSVKGRKQHYKLTPLGELLLEVLG